MADKMKITFLGTGSAIPTARRNHVSMLLQYRDENILFDCGEGTQRQFRRAKLNPCKVTKILITHWHGDHILGLPGLLQTLVLNGYSRKLMIYGPRGTKTKMKEIMDLFMRWYLGVGKREGVKFDLEVHEVSDSVFFETEDYMITASSMNHGIPSVAYSFETKKRTRIDKEKLKKYKIANSPLIGDLVKGKVVEIDGRKIDGKKITYTEEGKKITFVMDTQMNENAIRISKGSDVLVCESTYSAEEKELAREHYHLTSQDAANIAKKSKSGKLVLIHMSQRYDEIPKVIQKEAREVFKNTFVVEDLDSFEV